MSKIKSCLLDNSHTCKEIKCCEFCRKKNKCEIACKDYKDGCRYLIEKESEVEENDVHKKSR